MLPKKFLRLRYIFAHAQRYAQTFRYAATFLDRSGAYRVHNAEHNFYILRLAFCRKIQHFVKALFSEVALTNTLIIAGIAFV